MQIVFLDGEGRHELDVRVNDPAATAGDLARALGARGADQALHVGGQATDPDFSLTEAGLHEGAVVRLVPAVAVTGAHAGTGPAGAGAGAGLSGAAARGGAGAGTGPRKGSGEGTGLDLVVVNGLDAGRRFRLGVGRAVVGRAHDCDLVVRHGTLSRRHAVVTVGDDGRVTVGDLGSHNGTWVGGEAVVEPVALGEGEPVRMGALRLEVRPARDGDRPVAFDPLRHVTSAGTIPFNRPPRPAQPPAPADLSAPQPPRTGQSKVPLSLIGILTPLAFAGVMYMVTRSPQMLLFAGLTPLMGIANAIDGKRRGRRSERSEKERFRRELRDLARALDERADEERARRRELWPDPAEVVRRAGLPSVTLWERRPGHDDFLRLRVGVGQVAWEPPVTRPSRTGEAPPELAEVLDAVATLDDAPVPLDLAGGGVVGVVGDRAAALATARSLLCQAAAFHGPADLPVMVLARPEVTGDWDWAKWLPHTRDASGAGRMLSGGPEQSTRMVEARLRAAGTRARTGAGRGARGSRAGGPGGSGGSGPGGGEGANSSAVGPALLVVVDDESLTEGRRAPARSLLRGDGGPVAGIVIAATVDRLPALCTAVVEVTDPDGRATLTLPQRGERVDGLVPAGMADDVARECARSLARFEDPELDVVGAGLPASIRLLPLLELGEPTPAAVLARWATGGVDPRPASPIGVTEDGVLTVDFVADGPHALVGGTTGSGKSELLRTLVAGMAATVGPDHLTFLLVDFKGGSAFDECARLPHTVGMVTDLDEHLAERALRCLEAELKHRERVLRRAGAVDLPDYLRSAAAGPGGTAGAAVPEPMPRLLVVIDEFATLKAELPRFIDALVGVAQRGRSLGVHMVLATQRPQGAISDNIRANTNMRIALRVQDANDSKDVIDVADAAAIPRTAPGRAYVRLGPSEVVAIQSALSTGSRSESVPDPVDVASFTYGPAPRAPVAGGAAPAGATDPSGEAALASDLSGNGDGSGDGGGETDLAVLVAAIDGAFARTGRPRPRRPWPDPLPGHVDLDALIDDALARTGPGPGSGSGSGDGPGSGDRTVAGAAVDGAGRPARLGAERGAYVPLAMADDPEAQSQYPVGWVPAEGNMLVYGLGGSGTTTTLTALALALARLFPPDDVHLYALDFGAGELGALAALPHVGGVMVAGERERQARLARHLRAELDRRRALGAVAARDEPAVVTLLDGWSAFAAEFNDLAGNVTWEAFGRVFADGPEVGLYTVVAADRASAVPHVMASLVRQKLALRLADKGDYTNFGVRSAAVPEMVPGRAIVAGSGQVTQVARPTDGPEAAAARLAAAHPVPTRHPVPMEALPVEVRFPGLGAGARLGERPWVVPVGVSEATRAPVGLVAYQGEHALVLGPARSGKSTVLLTVAASCRAAAGPEPRVVAVAGRRSPLAGDPLVDDLIAPADLGASLGALVDGVDGPVLVLVDDAESVEDVGGVLGRLSTSERPDLLFVAAGRNDGVRGGYSHWSRPLRRSRLGVLLKPEVDLDGDVLGVSLPRRPPVAMVAGRGYVAAAGEVELAQVALPR